MIHWLHLLRYKCQGIISLLFSIDPFSFWRTSWRSYLIGICWIVFFWTKKLGICSWNSPSWHLCERFTMDGYCRLDWDNVTFVMRFLDENDGNQENIFIVMWWVLPLIRDILLCNIILNESSRLCIIKQLFIAQKYSFIAKEFIKVFHLKY